ncbi:MAG: type II toxin-antitoxin system VapC family toxin [Candidatus Heimdallarchaeota archaeon]|nr:type II toxin-antitoxin system VapC family toxin [Candidatus Heimdallarchaeota archaeon]
MSGINDLTSYSGPVVVDTGLFIEFFLKSELGGIFNVNILENHKINKILIHNYSITELYYILCRNFSQEIATEFVEDIKIICRIIPSEEIWREAGAFKCQYAISISDCFSLAIAKKYNIPVLFKSEKEILKEQNKQGFDVQLIIL